MRTPLIDAVYEGRTEAVRLLCRQSGAAGQRDENGRTALFIASEHGYLDIVGLLLDSGASLDLQDERGRTALLMAVAGGHEGIVTLLLNSGAHPSIRDATGRTPLISAIENRRVGIVQMLLDRGTSVNVRDGENKTALMLAIELPDLDITRLLLSRGAEADARYPDGRTMLMLAVENRRPEIAELLLERGADVKAQDINGKTALLVAIEKGCQEAVPMLLGAGAEAEHRDDCGRTALVMAVEKMDRKLVELLLERGTSMEVRDHQGKTPLMIAVESGDSETTRLLLGRGADADARYPDGRTMLMLAAENRRLEIAELLLERGAEVEAQDKNAKTALMIAVEQGCQEAVPMLLRAGADVDHRDDCGRTALVMAVEKKDPKTVELLLERGASIEIQDRQGKTPLMVAVESGDAGTMELLLSRGADGEGNGRSFTPNMVRLLRDSKVFCMFPWTQLKIHFDGNVFPCCASDNKRPIGRLRSTPLAHVWDSEEMRRLRVNMLRGIESPECARCYRMEKEGALSERQFANEYHMSRASAIGATAEDGSAPQAHPNILHIDFSNLCNFRCRYCEFETSTAWHRESRILYGLPEGVPVLRTPTARPEELLEQIEPYLDRVEWIHFVGGEPLIMPEQYRFLEMLSRKGLFRVGLSYNTNFSITSLKGQDIFELWKPFERINVIASLDCADARGEYIRKGQDWGQVIRTRERMLQVCPDVRFMVNPAVTVLNAFSLPDFYEDWVSRGWLEAGNITTSIVMDKEEYCIQALPENLKQRVEAKYENCIDRFIRPLGESAFPAEKTFRAIVAFMKARDLSDRLPRFREITRRLDSLRGERFEEVFPELSELMS